MFAQNQISQVDRFIQRILTYPLQSGFTDLTEVKLLWHLFNDHRMSSVFNQVYSGVRESLGDRTDDRLLAMGAEVNFAHLASMSNHQEYLRGRLAQTQAFYQLQQQLNDQCAINETMAVAVAQLQTDLAELNVIYNQVVKENTGLYAANMRQVKALKREAEENDLKKTINEKETEINDLKIANKTLEDRVKELEEKLKSSPEHTPAPPTAQLAVVPSEPEPVSSLSHLQLSGMTQWNIYASKMDMKNPAQCGQYLIQMFSTLSTCLGTTNNHVILKEHLRFAGKYSGVTYDHPMYSALTSLVSIRVIDAIPNDKQQAFEPIRKTLVAQINLLPLQKFYVDNKESAGLTEHQQRLAYIQEILDSYMTRFKGDPGLLENNRYEKLGWIKEGLLNKNLTCQAAPVLTPLNEWSTLVAKMDKTKPSQNHFLLSHIFKALNRAHPNKNSHTILVQHLRLAANHSGVTYDHPVYTLLSPLLLAEVLDTVSDIKQKAYQDLAEIVTAQLTVLPIQKIYIYDPSNLMQSDQQQRLAFLREIVQCYMTRFQNDPGLLEKNRFQKLQWMHERFLVKKVTHETSAVVTPVFLSDSVNTVHDVCIREIQACQDKLFNKQGNASTLVEDSLETIFYKIEKGMKKNSDEMPLSALVKLSMFHSFFLRPDKNTGKTIQELYIHALVPPLNGDSSGTFNTLSTPQDKAGYLEKIATESFKHLKRFKADKNLISESEYAKGEDMVALLVCILAAYSECVTANENRKVFAQSLKNYIVENKERLASQHECSLQQKSGPRNKK